MKDQKGFTIIELIVVIAIIAVLASIVLVNVTQYINKGKDAAIQGNLTSIMTNAAIYFDTCGQYTANSGSAITSCQTAFQASSSYTVPVAAITAMNKAVAQNINATNYCVCSTLYNATNGTYCIDSTGYKKATNTACSTRCPTGGACTD